MEKKTILLVEDEIYIWRDIKEFLEISWYKVTFASNLNDAEKIVAGQLFDVLITDTSLTPDNRVTDWIIIAESFIEKNPDWKIIAISMINRSCWEVWLNCDTFLNNKSLDNIKKELSKLFK